MGSSYLRLVVLFLMISMNFCVKLKPIDVLPKILDDFIRSHMDSQIVIPASITTENEPCFQTEAEHHNLLRRTALPRYIWWDPISQLKVDLLCPICKSSNLLIPKKRIYSIRWIHHIDCPVVLVSCVSTQIRLYFYSFSSLFK